MKKFWSVLMLGLWFFVALNGNTGVLAQCSLPWPAPGTVNVTITTDNAYVFGFGTSAGITTLFPGVDNCTGGDIYNCGPGAECYNVPANLNNEYVYIVAWSDNAVLQGTIAQFTDGVTTVLTAPISPSTNPQWEVYATGNDLQPCPTIGVPNIAALNTQIGIANAGTGASGTTSVTWVNTTGRGPTAPAVSEVGRLNFSSVKNGNAPGAPFPPAKICNINNDAYWMWYNPNPAVITNAFVEGSHPNFPASEMREYYIFRIGPLAAVLGTDTCVIPPTGMAAWWPLDETQGLTANDIGGATNNSGTWINNPTSGAGKVAGALCFNGTNYVEANNDAELNLGTGNFSIDAWVKRDVAGTNSPPSVIVDKRDGGSGIGYSLAVSFGRPILTMSGTNFSTATAPVPPDGQWHLVAVTVNRASGGGRFYCDGIALDMFTPLASNLDNTNHLRIGAGDLGGNQPWLGCIDELEIYNRALDSTEIRAIYNADSLGKCKPNTCCPKGDMNGDGQLTPADIVLLLNCVYLGTPPCNCHGDMNGDGQFTPADVVLLLNCVYLAQCPPCP